MGTWSGTTFNYHLRFANPVGGSHPCVTENLGIGEKNQVNLTAQRDPAWGDPPPYTPHPSKKVPGNSPKTPIKLISKLY